MGKASRESTDRSGPQPGFANLETIELRRDTTSGSVGGRSHFSVFVSSGALCACPEAE